MKNTIMFICWLVALYLLGSFIATSFNIKQWHAVLRWFIAMLMFSLSLRYSESLNEN